MLCPVEATVPTDPPSTRSPTYVFATCLSLGIESLLHSDGLCSMRSCTSLPMPVIKATVLASASTTPRLTPRSPDSTPKPTCITPRNKALSSPSPSSEEAVIKPAKIKRPLIRQVKKVMRPLGKYSARRTLRPVPLPCQDQL